MYRFWSSGGSFVSWTVVWQIDQRTSKNINDTNPGRHLQIKSTCSSSDTRLKLVEVEIPQYRAVSKNVGKKYR